MAPRGRGRPRTFDRARALRSAMEVFWARGYEGATLEELQTAMGGIAPPSFYAAFGSKDELFREAVTLYYSGMREHIMAALDAPTAKASIEAMMRVGIEQFTTGEGPTGCLIVLGALNLTKGNKDAHDFLFELRQQGLEIIRQRLARGVADGDIPAGAPLSEMAFFYFTVMHGLAVRARDGASRQALMAAARGAIAAWDPMVNQSGRARGKPARRKSA